MDSCYSIHVESKTFKAYVAIKIFCTTKKNKQTKIKQIYICFEIKTLTLRRLFYLEQRIKGHKTMTGAGHYNLFLGKGTLHLKHYMQAKGGNSIEKGEQNNSHCNS